MFKKARKLKAQSLIEIVMAIALAAFFMGITVMGFALTSGKYANYNARKNAFDVLAKQKIKNEVNLGRFLSSNKSLYGWSTLGAFPYQGAHQSYSNLNYYISGETDDTVLNQEKKFFANDSPLVHWSLDGVPTSSAYIIDELARKAVKGTLSCLGDPCNEPYIISPSLGRCVHNDCIQFAGDSNGGGLVSFAANTTVDGIKKITWEAWVYPTSVSTDQVFLSKQGNNYFRILNSKANISLVIDGTQRTLTGNTILQNNTWYHLTASFNGSKLKLYVNGVLDADVGLYSGDLDFDTGLMYWGLWTSADRKPFNGYMDEVRIYSNALEDNEILNHYKAYREKIGLLGYWHFDDALGIADYNDVNQIGVNPRFKTFSVPDNLPISTTLVSAINNEANCKNSSCLLFNGSYASKGVFEDSPGTYSLFHNPGKLTLEMWINPSSVSGVQGLITKNSATNYNVYLNGSSIVYSLKVGGTQYTETYAAGLEANVPHLLDFTFDGANMSLYIDGVLKQSWNHPGTISADDGYNDIYIGWTGSGTEYFNGYMDELRIYNRALSLDEINNRYDGGYTYYQYFKPVCKVSNTGGENDVLDSECINCVPTNASECETGKVHTALEPLLNTVWDVVKWGQGVNYSKLDIKQVETPLRDWQNSVLSGTKYDWRAGIAGTVADPCQEFTGVGDSGGFVSPENCACGDTSCCSFDWYKISDDQVCSASNISFFADNGCSDCGYSDEEPPPGLVEQVGNKWCLICADNAYFRMTDAASSPSYFISPTFSIARHFGLLNFEWEGALNGGKVKVQMACKESITDENGDLVGEDTWEYLAPNPNHTTRCSSDYYYDISNTPLNNKPSTCWETDNLPIHNCKFFRYKLYLESDIGGITSPVITSLFFNQGVYIE